VRDGGGDIGVVAGGACQLDGQVVSDGIAARDAFDGTGGSEFLGVAGDDRSG
jgi:hypothetical protein